MKSSNFISQKINTSHKKYCMSVNSATTHLQPIHIFLKSYTLILVCLLISYLPSSFAIVLESSFDLNRVSSPIFQTLIDSINQDTYLNPITKTVDASKNTSTIAARMNIDVPGKTLYADKKCATCHGANGEGTALAGPLLKNSKCVTCKDKELFIKKTTDTMPPKEEAICDTECSTQIQSYLETLETAQMDSLSEMKEPNKAIKDGTCVSPKNDKSMTRLFNMITKKQYSNLLKNILKIQITPELEELIDSIPKASKAEGLALNIGLISSPSHFNAFKEVADRAALLAVQNFEANFNCAPTAKECILPLIQIIAEQMFKRSATAAEINFLNKHYTMNPNAQGLTAVLIAILTSPTTVHFLDYAAPGSSQLSGHTIAARLSYLLWNDAPSSDLIKAAQNGALDTKEGILLQAEKMLEDDRFRNGLMFFVTNWLRTEGSHPHAQAEIALLISNIIGANGTFANLFETTDSYVSEDTAKIYNVKKTTTKQFDKVKLSEQYKGILTRAAITRKGAKGYGESPLHRGLFIRNVLLCQTIPAPPPEEVQEFPQLPTNYDTTVVEKFKAHHLKSTKQCVDCHEYIDPVGFLFSNFDGFGRYRTEYVLKDPKGVGKDIIKPVNTKGYIRKLANAPSDIVGEYENHLEFTAKIKQSETARRCFATKFYHRALARKLVPGDDCLLNEIYNKFAANDFVIKDLIYAIISSDAFRFRAL